jgi:hypothetical protein
MAVLRGSHPAAVSFVFSRFDVLDNGESPRNVQDSPQGSTGSAVE